MFITATFRGPISVTVFVIVAFWWFYVIVIDATYSANLIAFMAIEKEHPPFETLSELADNNDYLIGVVGGTAWVDEMRVSIFFLCTFLFRKFINYHWDLSNSDRVIL